MYRIYLDANVTIYLVQNTPNAPQVRTYLQAQVDSILCSSNLSLLECLVLPFQQANRHLQQRFYTFFQSLELIPARRQVFLRAAQIRAATRLRTPDALHLAFAAMASAMCCSQAMLRWGRSGSRAVLDLLILRKSLLSE